MSRHKHEVGFKEPEPVVCRCCKKEEVKVSGDEEVLPTILDRGKQGKREMYCGDCWTDRDCGTPECKHQGLEGKPWKLQKLIGKSGG